jgi:hypothetical protein
MNSRKDNQHGRNLALTSRDHALLSCVADHGVLERNQIARACGFRSVTRANSRLKRLVDANLLQRLFLPTAVGSRMAVYRAAESTKRATWRGSPLLIQHALAVNDVRLAFECCKHPDYSFLLWTSEDELRGHNIGVVADGFVEYAFRDLRFSAFVEADRGTEALTRWQAKVRSYLSLAFSGRYSQAFRRKYFRVLVTAPTIARLENLRRATAALTADIFWFCRTADLTQEGPLTPIWRRSRTDDNLTLTAGGQP